MDLALEFVPLAARACLEAKGDGAVFGGSWECKLTSSSPHPGFKEKRRKWRALHCLRVSPPRS